MGGLELFTSGSEVFVQSPEGCARLTEDAPIINDIMERIDTMYPDAGRALRECYSKSSKNIPYYNFLMVRRFCKCNFGSLDHTRKDIEGTLNFERVQCPLRGECRNEGIICSPKVMTALTEAEKRVMRLVCEGRSNTQIADELYISPNTVKKHISTSFLKTGCRNRAEFVKYANEHSIFS